MTRADALEARARLEGAIRRVLPLVGLHATEAMLQRLAQELAREGVVVKHPEAARRRARKLEQPA